MLVPKQTGFQENKRFQTCHHLLLVLVCLLITQKLDHSVAEIQVLCTAEFKDRREHIQPPFGEMLFFTVNGKTQTQNAFSFSSDELGPGCQELWNSPQKWQNSMTHSAPLKK